MLYSVSVHRWCDLRERSPVDQAVTGTRREYTPPWFGVVVFKSRAHLVSQYEVVYASDSPAI
jgi:hypothetical protein